MSLDVQNEAVHAASPTLAPVTARVAGLGRQSAFADATLARFAGKPINLLAGVPDVQAHPDFSAVLAELYAQPDVQGPTGSARLFEYSPTQGYPELREWVAAREGVHPDRILITAGGQHGLSLAVQLAVEPGSLVAIENPLWPLSLRILELQTTNTLPVPVDAHGLDTRALEERLRAGQTISAVYTVPDFHNPTAVSLSDERRAHLVALAEEFGFWVIADNPYREVRFPGTVPGDLRALNDSANVIHVNSFSKTLGPGLRLGWLVLPKRAVADAVQLRNRVDSQSSSLVQGIITRYLTAHEDLYETTLAAANARYGARARFLVDQLEARLPGAFASTVPAGGYFLWTRLTDDAVDAHALHAASRDEGLNYQSGYAFTAGPGTDADRYLRLAYGDNPEPVLAEGVARLARAYAKAAG